MPRLTNLSNLYKPAAAVSGAKSANTGSAASKPKAPQGKSANMFYTNTPNSGTIVPRFNNISAYNKAIEEGNKTLDDLAHRQFQAMLKNDVPAMNALEKQYKDTERYIGSFRAELGEVMGAGIHGPKGNQLTGSGWFGRMMDELSADGGKVHVTQLGYPDGPPPMPQRPPVPEGHPDRETFEKDLKEILAPEEMDKKGDASSGGGYADFFREQREGEKSDAVQVGYADLFREQREGDASEDTRKDTGYEYISKQDFDSKLALLETRPGWNSEWLDEADAKLAVNYSDESAQRVYNHCLENTIELKKQIDELKEQRAWSEKYELVKDNPLFNTDEYINNQNELGTSTPFGSKGNAADNCCGAIAAHNINLLFGEDSNFTDVYTYFNDDSKLLAKGKMGVNPFALIDYLKDNGRQVTIMPASADSLKEPGKFIYTYMWYTQEYGWGAHYMAGENNGSSIVVYNPYSSQANANDMQQFFLSDLNMVTFKDNVDPLPTIKKWVPFYEKLPQEDGIGFVIRVD